MIRTVPLFGRTANAAHDSISTLMQALRACAPALLALCAFAVLAEPAVAALPAAVSPPAAAASGDYIAIGQDYFKKGLLFLGLLISTLGFLAVAGGGIAKFNDYRTGRAELGDLAMFAVIGVVVLVLMVYLATEASTIL
ncbi:MAG: TIGR03745 family integrating conjugative element membrane protein [Chromatiales bacterium]|nr:TIGR03745 family integrating conjugative element membrane protein [Chromatiales bacterium]